MPPTARATGVGVGRGELPGQRPRLGAREEHELRTGARPPRDLPALAGSRRLSLGLRSREGTVWAGTAPEAVTNRECPRTAANLGQRPGPGRGPVPQRGGVADASRLGVPRATFSGRWPHPLGLSGRALRTSLP